jgi:hypothetical protein
MFHVCFQVLMLLVTLPFVIVSTNRRSKSLTVILCGQHMNRLLILVILTCERYFQKLFSVGLGLAQPLSEMGTRNLPYGEGGKGLLARKADSLTSIYERIV